MITVRVSYQDGVITRLTITGHGGAKKGKDLVCAAVSAVSIGGLNALRHPDDHKISISDGHLSYEKAAQSDPHDLIVMETVVRQLASIAEAEPTRIRLITKEG